VGSGLVGPEIVVNKNEERRRVSAEVIYQAFGELDRAKANRRRMLRISESSSPPAYESTGSRAIPHFEQTPGPSATTSGVHRAGVFRPRRANGRHPLLSGACRGGSGGWRDGVFGGLDSELL
jgi:hypothetical protein